MKTIRLFFGLFLLFAGVYAAWKILPPYFSNYEFEAAMDDTARLAAVDSKKTPEDIRTAVLDKARSIDVPVNFEDISVERNGTDVSISADYTVHVDMPLYPVNLNFHPSTKRQGLLVR